MGRDPRAFVSQCAGSYHIISRTVGGDLLLRDREKEYFMNLLERLASGFFVQIHAFCIMGNHFHIMASNLDEDARNASKEELLERYRRLYPKQGEPPQGSQLSNGDIIYDDDSGIERLRDRLGCISRFVQELKQSFTRWYNKIHEREGFFWSARFKCVILSKGVAQLMCSSYIDLNPVRANLVSEPEAYRWCSLGLRVRNPRRAERFLTLLSATSEDVWDVSGRVNLEVLKSIKPDSLPWYRGIVYCLGGMEREGKAAIPKELRDEVLSYHGKLGIGDRFRYRVRNISEGLVMGGYEFVAEIQKRSQRKFIRPRSFLSGNVLYTTRVLHQ